MTSSHFHNFIYHFFFDKFGDGADQQHVGQI